MAGEMTYLDKLKAIEAVAKVSEWPQWKLDSMEVMRFGEDLTRLD